MMKKIIPFLILLVFTIVISAPALAENGVKVTLPNGTEVPLDGLDDNEKAYMLKYMEKINKAASEKVASQIGSIAKDAMSDPSKLDAWRRVITGTIKDICNDLNVTVNEFIKTPVGMGVAALIFYKVAGKDLLETLFDIVMIIPIWFIICATCGVIAYFLLGPITVYQKIEPVEIKGKIKYKKSHPERRTRYNFKTNDSRNTAAVILIIIPILMTFVSILIVFL